MAIESGCCSNPPALTEDELEAALAGIADAAVEEHLSRCSYCASRLAVMQRFERKLQARLYRQACPGANVLGDYVLGLLGDGQHRAVEQHLTTCLACSNEVQVLQVALLGRRRADLPVSTLATDVARGLKRIIASILPPAPGLALRGSDDVRRITAVTKHAHILLEISPEREGYSLTGQVLGEDDTLWDGALVEIYQDGDLAATAVLDHMNEFACRKLRPMPLRLHISAIGGPQVVIEDLPVK